MTLVVISEKGQITIPAGVRRKLGLKPKTKVDVEIRDNEIVVRPIKSVMELYGILHHLVEGKNEDWETVRRKTEEIVAREVAREGTD